MTSRRHATDSGPPERLPQHDAIAADLGHDLQPDTQGAHTGTLWPQVEAVLPLDQVRGALARVAGRHTRGKIVLQIGS